MTREITLRSDLSSSIRPSTVSVSVEYTEWLDKDDGKFKGWFYELE